MRRKTHLITSAALLLGASAFAQEPQQFIDGKGSITVQAIPFSDAVGRVLMDVETPTGALFTFETLLTLNRVSVTAFVNDGYVSLSERCGQLQWEAGSGTLESLGYYSPELKSWSNVSTTVDQLKTACGACAFGDDAACRSCAGHTIAAFVEGDCTFDTLGNGSDNGDYDNGYGGEALPSCAFRTNGNGSDNGDYDNGTESISTGCGLMSTNGNGSDNGDYDNGYGGEALPSSSSRTNGNGSDNGDYDNGTGST